MPKHYADTTRNPDTMTADERRDEVAGISPTYLSLVDTEQAGHAPAAERVRKMIRIRASLFGDAAWSATSGRDPKRIGMARSFIVAAAVVISLAATAFAQQGYPN